MEPTGMVKEYGNDLTSRKTGFKPFLSFLTFALIIKVGSVISTSQTLLSVQTHGG